MGDYDDGIEGGDHISKTPDLISWSRFLSTEIYKILVSSDTLSAQAVTSFRDTVTPTELVILNMATWRYAKFYKRNKQKTVGTNTDFVAN